MDRDVRIGSAFEAALQAASCNAQLWVPGVGNGALGGTLRALARLPDNQIIALIRQAVARESDEAPESGEVRLTARIVSEDATVCAIRVAEEEQRIVRLKRTEVEAGLARPGYWLPAIDPQTVAARIVSRNPDGFDSGSVFRVISTFLNGRGSGLLRQSSGSFALKSMT